jgi:hypothetical protein
MESCTKTPTTVSSNSVELVLSPSYSTTITILINLNSTLNNLLLNFIAIIMATSHLNLKKLYPSQIPHKCAMFHRNQVKGTTSKP